MACLCRSLSVSSALKPYCRHSFTGPIALILQNRFATSALFRNFAGAMKKGLVLEANDLRYQAHQKEQEAISMMNDILINRKN